MANRFSQYVQPATQENPAAPTAPTAPTAQGAPTAGNRFTQYVPQEMRPRHWGDIDQGMDWLTMGATTKAGAAMDAGLNYAVDSVMGRDANFSEGYNKSLEEMRLGKAIYENENPIQSKLAGAGGVLIGAPVLPMVGRGLTGAVGTGALYGAAGGALEDADSVGERLTNAGQGAVGGAALGGAGYGAGKLAGNAISGVGSYIKNWNLTPEMRAAATVAQAGDKAYGPYNAMQMDKKMADLGPDAVRADVLGEQGLALTRQGANLDPAAREAAESFAYGRRSGQNPRLVNDIQAAAGITPERQWQSVDDMILADQTARRPAIDQAYDQARLMGAEIPFTAYDDILSHPVAKEAFELAKHNVALREGVGQQGGNLATLDELKRIMDVQGGQYGSASGDASRTLSKVLRERTDKLIHGPEYSDARNLRRNAYQSENAFDVGAKLGGNKVPINVDNIAKTVVPEHAPNMAAAYAQTKAQSLLNNNNKPGAMDQFTTGLGKRAMESALGSDGAAKVGKGVAREQQYNRLPNALGNSSTARQLHEMKSLGNEDSSWGDYIPDSASSAVFGVFRKGMDALGRSVASESKTKAAPDMVKMLIDKGVLPSNVADQGNLNPHLNQSPLEMIGNINPQNIGRIFAQFGAAPETDPSLATEVSKHNRFKPYYREAR